MAGDLVADRGTDDAADQVSGVALGAAFAASGWLWFFDAPVKLSKKLIDGEPAGDFAGEVAADVCADLPSSPSKKLICGDVLPLLPPDPD